MRKYLLILGSILLCILIFIIGPYFLIKSSFSSSCGDDSVSNASKNCGSIISVKKSMIESKKTTNNRNQMELEIPLPSEMPNETIAQNTECHSNDK